jgi:hypothetical protein
MIPVKQKGDGRFDPAIPQKKPNNDMKNSFTQ